jgi:UrcA family protein
MNLKPLILAIAGLAGLPFAAGAAIAPADAPSVRVQFADLDLTRDAGVEHLYVRLRHAASTVCDQHADVRDFRALASERTCTNQVLDRAVAEIRSSRLSARHALGTPAPRVAMQN